MVNHLCVKTWHHIYVQDTSGDLSDRMVWLATIITTNIACKHNRKYIIISRSRRSSSRRAADMGREVRLYAKTPFSDVPLKILETVLLLI